MEDAINMRSPLRILEGLTVTKVVELHGYVQLHFGDQIGVSIYNKLGVHPQSASVDELIGKTVITVTDRKSAIEIEFLDGPQLTIDMQQQAYQGSEALELDRQGYPPVIWN